MSTLTARWWGQVFGACTGAWEVARETVVAFFHHDGFFLAGSIAFASVLSLIPTLALVLALAGYVLSSSDELFLGLLTLVRITVPDLSQGLALDLLKLVEQRAWVGGIGVVTLLATSGVLFGAVECAMYRIFPGQRRRYLLSQLLSLLALVGIGALLFLSFLARLLARAVEGSSLYVLGVDVFDLLIHSLLIRYVVPFLLLGLMFFAILKVVPGVRIRMAHALGGGLAGAILFELARQGFAWYASNVAAYGPLYGPLATLFVLLLWIFYGCILLVLVAEGVAVLERRAGGEAGG